VAGSVRPAVTARLEARVQPLIGALGLRRAIHTLIVQEQLPISVEGSRHGTGARHPRVVVAIFPRWIGSVDVGVRHFRAVLLLDLLSVVIVHLHRSGWF